MVPSPPVRLAAGLVLLTLSTLLGAQDLPGRDLVPEAASAVLADQTTGRILFQKNPDLEVPPASLTKLMTLHLAWKAIDEGRVRASDLVPVTPATTGASVPPGSSLMFLEPGQKVTLGQVMLGLAVDSGNDAGMTLAQFLAGSQQAFVTAMNAEAQALGLNQTVFFDAFGYDEHNRTTAGDFARFSRAYIQAHPQSLALLHSVRSLTYPQAENLDPASGRQAPPITQTNRNTLLGEYPGADGLKTGYIDESGYNLAATAVRGPQRLVAVLLGIRGRDAAEGGRLRTAAAARLLDYGFDTHPLKALPLPAYPRVRAWFSAPGTVEGTLAGPAVYPLSPDEAQGITVALEAPAEVAGPVKAGDRLGSVVWSQGGREFYRLAWVASADAPAAPWWTAALDHVVLFFRGIFGTPAPAQPGL